jgi:hypothetical protein
VRRADTAADEYLQLSPGIDLRRLTPETVKLLALLPAQRSPRGGIVVTGAAGPVRPAVARRLAPCSDAVPGSDDIAVQ